MAKSKTDAPAAAPAEPADWAAILEADLRLLEAQYRDAPKVFYAKLPSPEPSPAHRPENPENGHCAAKAILAKIEDFRPRLHAMIRAVS